MGATYSTKITKTYASSQTTLLLAISIIKSSYFKNCMTNKSREERKLKASPYCTLLAPEPMSEIIQHKQES